MGSQNSVGDEIKSLRTSKFLKILLFCAIFDNFWAPCLFNDQQIKVKNSTVSAYENPMSTKPNNQSLRKSVLRKLFKRRCLVENFWTLGISSVLKLASKTYLGMHCWKRGGTRCWAGRGHNWGSDTPPSSGWRGPAEPAEKPWK